MAKKVKETRIQRRTLSKIRLFDFFVQASDAIADLPWRIYDSKDHNKLVTSDYSHSDTTDKNRYWDDLKVISADPIANKDGELIAFKVYVK